MVTGGGGGHFDLRLKEAFYLSRVEVHDKEDGDEWKNLFEVAPRDQQPILLSCRTHDEKRNWMAILVMLTTKRYHKNIHSYLLSIYYGLYASNSNLELWVLYFFVFLILY